MKILNFPIFGKLFLFKHESAIKFLFLFYNLQGSWSRISSISRKWKILSFQSALFNIQFQWIFTSKIKWSNTFILFSKDLIIAIFDAILQIHIHSQLLFFLLFFSSTCTSSLAASLEVTAGLSERSSYLCLLWQAGGQYTFLSSITSFFFFFPVEFSLGKISKSCRYKLASKNLEGVLETSFHEGEWLLFHLQLKIWQEKSW